MDISKRDFTKGLFLSAGLAAFLPVATKAADASRTSLPATKKSPIGYRRPKRVHHIHAHLLARGDSA